MRVALDTADAGRPRQLRRPGQDRRPSSRQAVAAGVTIEIESDDRGRARRRDRRASSGIRPRVAVRVNPDFAGQGLGHAHGRRAAAVRRRRRAGAGAARRARRGRRRRSSASTSSPARRTSTPRSSCEAQRKTVELVAASWPTHAPAPVRYLNLGGGFGIPYFDSDQPLDLAAVGENLARAGRRRDPAEPAGRARRDRARPLHRRRVRAST